MKSNLGQNLRTDDDDNTGHAAVVAGTVYSLNRSRSSPVSIRSFIIFVSFFIRAAHVPINGCRAQDATVLQ
jgi:hypothetical protein